jgi:hypothetical protein
MIENISLSNDQQAPSWRFNSQIWLDTKITDGRTRRIFVKFRVVKGKKKSNMDGKNLHCHYNCVLGAEFTLIMTKYWPQYVHFEQFEFKTHLIQYFSKLKIRVCLKFQVLFFTIRKPRTHNFPRTSGLLTAVVNFTDTAMFAYKTNLLYL